VSKKVMFFVVVAGGEVAGLYQMEADALIRARGLDGGSVVPLRVNEPQCVKGDRPVEWSPKCDARLAAGCTISSPPVQTHDPASRRAVPERHPPCPRLPGHASRAPDPEDH